MTGRSSGGWPCQENPWLVERGEGGAVNTSLSSGPNRAPLAHSRLRRVRPIQRGDPYTDLLRPYPARGRRTRGGTAM